MLNYKNILIATDLSKSADLLAKRAKDITNGSDAAISVIHVMEHSPVAYGGEFSIPIDVNLEQSLEENALKSLQTFVEHHQLTDAKLHLEKGSVKLAVTEKASEIHADLIIVGTHGHHGIDILLGSRANAILHVAPCDVLVVRIKE